MPTTILGRIQKLYNIIAHSIQKNDLLDNNTRSLDIYQYYEYIKTE